MIALIINVQGIACQGLIRTPPKGLIVQSPRSETTISDAVFLFLLEIENHY